MSGSLQKFMDKVSPRFIKMNNENGQLLSWEQECHFAKQQITKNDFSMKVAQANQASLANAIQNVAAIGISLNPASAYAYLVPRDGAICLDISYKGLIKLATDTGSILWAKADLVYEKDSFIYRGPSEKPEHHAEVFGERGNLVGAYCIAKTNEGDYLIETMDLKQIHAVRDTSKAYQSGKKGCPWLTFYEEMVKKTVIKRASKTWPHTEKRERLDRAISVINEHEGLREKFTPEQKEEFDLLFEADNALGMYIFGLEHSSETNGGDGVLDALQSTFAPGQKVKNKERLNELLKDGNMVFYSTVQTINEMASENDQHGIDEILEDFPEAGIKHLAEKISNEALPFINKQKGAA